MWWKLNFWFEQQWIVGCWAKNLLWRKSEREKVGANFAANLLAQELKTLDQKISEPSRFLLFVFVAGTLPLLLALSYAIDLLPQNVLSSAFALTPATWAYFFPGMLLGIPMMLNNAMSSKTIWGAFFLVFLVGWIIKPLGVNIFGIYTICGLVVAGGFYIGLGLSILRKPDLRRRIAVVLAARRKFNLRESDRYLYSAQYLAQLTSNITEKIKSGTPEAEAIDEAVSFFLQGGNDERRLGLNRSKLREGMLSLVRDNEWTLAEGGKKA